MIFTKQIEQITYNDIVSFCDENVRESVNLDYKQNFPNELEKTISSFANTYGGIIIIGIADDDGYPKKQFEGIDFVNGLSEKIQNINISNIYPPVELEIKIAKKEDGTKCFIIIRIPQSSSTPHAIRHNTLVYYRTGDVSSPEKLMDLEKIDWLKNQRAKALDFKNVMLERSRRRFNNSLKLYNINSPLTLFTQSISPLYPDKAILNYDSLLEIKDKLKISGHGKTGYSYFTYDFGSIQNGIANMYYDERTKNMLNYAEINQFGLMFNIKRIERNPHQEKNYYHVYLSRIIISVNFFTMMYLKLCEEINIYGILEYNLRLNAKTDIIFIDSRDHFIDNPQQLPETEINFKKIFAVEELKNCRIDITTKILKEVFWSIGFKNIDSKYIKNFLEEGNVK